MISTQNNNFLNTELSMIRHFCWQILTDGIQAYNRRILSVVDRTYNFYAIKIFSNQWIFWMLVKSFFLIYFSLLSFFRIKLNSGRSIQGISLIYCYIVKLPWILFVKKGKRMFRVVILCHNNLHSCVHIYLYMDVCLVSGHQSKKDSYLQYLLSSFRLSERSSLVYFGAKTTQRAGPTWTRKTGNWRRQGPRTLVRQV